MVRMKLEAPLRSAMVPVSSEACRGEDSTWSLPANWVPKLGVVEELWVVEEVVLEDERDDDLGLHAGARASAESASRAEFDVSDPDARGSRT
jgi:hypothetical protein